MRAHVFRYAPKSGHCATDSTSPFRANFGSRPLYSITSSARVSSPGGTETDSSGCLEIDAELHFCGLLDRKVARLGPPQNLVNVFRVTSHRYSEVLTVTEQETDPRRQYVVAHGGDSMAKCHLDNVQVVLLCEGVRSEVRSIKMFIQ